MSTADTSEGCGLVVIVDDDASVRKALGRILHSAGHRVESFASAEEFFAAGPWEGPTCTILDLAMPGMSGLEIQARLVEEKLGYGVIFLSGRGDINSSVDAMKHGAVDFLTKPVDESLLLPAVDEALERQNSAVENRVRQADVKERFALLTKREGEVLELIVIGRLNKQIAAELDISEKTVKAHRAQIMRKTQSGSLAMLVRLHIELHRTDR
jgi:FixJ family two-component response regulator